MFFETGAVITIWYSPHNPFLKLEYFIQIHFIYAATNQNSIVMEMVGDIKEIFFHPKIVKDKSSKLDYWKLLELSGVYEITWTCATDKIMNVVIHILNYLKQLTKSDLIHGK